MCGRFVLQTPAETLQRLFGFVLPGASWDPERTDRPRFNIAPTQPILVVGAGPVRLGAWARWGMVAAHGRLAINARSETVFSRPTFRDAIRGHRAIVPADGFIEWKVEQAEPLRRAKRMPHLVHRKDRAPMAFAAVTARGRVGDDEVFTAAILTTAANPDVKPLHDRMPVLLDGLGINAWLDPGLDARPEVERWLVPAAEGLLEVRAINERVNKVDHDDPSCLEPPERTTAPRTRQLGFDFF